MAPRAAGSYAEDRAAIDDLQARYLFAMDFHDPDLYVTTFTEDGSSMSAPARSRAGRRSRP
jgi:hypothetical protein